MKYKKIYDVIGSYPELKVDNRSWYNIAQNISATNVRFKVIHPLSIILDMPQTDLQIWVDHERGRYSISTHYVHSCERNHNFQCYYFRNQMENTKMLKSKLKYKDYTPYPGFYDLRIFKGNSKEFFAVWRVQEFLYRQSMQRNYYKHFAPLEWEKLKDLSAQLQMVLLPKLKPGESLR